VFARNYQRPWAPAARDPRQIRRLCRGDAAGLARWRVRQGRRALASAVRPCRRARKPPAAKRGLSTASS
jgi:hypothetical protein